jgi:glutaconyl-CoA/methylmalonyl-CoA decarboxylase subunit gamma
MHYQLKIGAQEFAVEVGAQKAGSLRVSVNGKPFDVMIQAPAAAAPLTGRTEPAVARPAAQQSAPMAAPDTSTPAAAAAGAEGAVLAPIPGLILEIKVKVGDTVQAGQSVAVMEAMKMENNLTSPVAGVITEILVQKGAEVATGDVILRIG